MPEVTPIQAKMLYKLKFWETMEFRDQAEFQLHTRYLCMPFGVFHKAMETALNRSVFVHEFALDLDGLKSELAGERPQPSLEDIVKLIPKDKKTLMEFITED